MTVTLTLTVPRPLPTGMVRLSELRCTAPHARPVRTALASPDDVAPQRDGAADAEAAEDSDAREAEGRAAPDGGPRRRRPARPPEPEEKLRGRRQRDFDNSENASSDEEGQRRDRGPAAEEPWTQSQQRLLELALQQYPKGSSDRWDKIAKCVPSKSKVGEAGPEPAAPGAVCLHLSAPARAASRLPAGCLGRAALTGQPGEPFPGKTAHVDHKFHPPLPCQPLRHSLCSGCSLSDARGGRPVPWSP